MGNYVPLDKSLSQGSQIYIIIRIVGDSLNRKL